MSRKERYAKAGTALFFLLLVVIGLWTVKDYTGSYDEIAEIHILASNMKEYAVALDKLGISWKNWLESSVGLISESIEKDHGICGYYLFGCILPWIQSNESLVFSIWSAVTWLWFMCGVWSIYAISRHLDMSRWISCIAALLLYLSPRFFADGHVNNKDIVVLCLMLATLWQGTRLLDRTSAARALMFSLAGAMAANTKIVGVIAWGLMLAAFMLKTTLEQKWNRKHIAATCTAVCGFVGWYVLLTPAMWKDPLQFITYLIGNASAFSRWGGVIYFRGAAFQLPQQRLPIYYLVYMIATTLPVYTFPLCFLGQIKVIISTVRKPACLFKDKKGLILVCASCCWIVSIGAYVLLRPLIYNGWRHFYFSLAGILVLAAYGIKVLWDWCSNSIVRKRLLAGILCLCFATSAAGIVINHPRQSSYYNVLASQKTMETDYWNTSGTYALKRLLECPERNPDLPLEVGCYFFDIQNARFKLNDEQKSLLTTTVEKNSPYLYYIENYVQVYTVPEPEGYHKLFEVDSYGRKIGTMYEKDI